MKKTIFIVIVVGVLAWVGYDFFSSDDDTSSEGNDKITAQPSGEKEEEVVESDDIGIKRGEIAPDFEVKTLDGNTAKLSDFRGEKVMLNFWATWCPPCRVEMPDMQKFHENEDVQILAVNLIDTEANRDVVTEFLDKLGITFPVLLDEGSELAIEYNIVAYPTSFMIDSNGRIQFVAMGAINYDIMIQEFEKME